MDVDWAPDAVLEYAVEWFDDRGIPITVFATHDTPLLHGRDPARVEIGIHPNLSRLHLDEEDLVKRTIGELLETYPQAKGVRCHSLVQSNRLIDWFTDLGLEYDADEFRPYEDSLKAIRWWSGLVRIPIFWEDDLHLAFRAPFDLKTLPLEGDGLGVFNFHPIHMYLNSSSLEHYHEVRPHYQDVDVLMNHVNTGEGIRTFAADLVDWFASRGESTSLMRQLAASPFDPASTWDGLRSDPEHK